MNIQGWAIYVSQAFRRQSNSQRVVRLMREMRCEPHADRRVKDIQPAINRRVQSPPSLQQAGKAS